MQTAPEPLSASDLFGSVTITHIMATKNTKPLLYSVQYHKPGAQYPVANVAAPTKASALRRFRLEWPGLAVESIWRVA